jgi:hypothetical protein
MTFSFYIAESGQILPVVCAGTRPVFISGNSYRNRLDEVILIQAFRYELKIELKKYLSNLFDNSVDYLSIRNETKYCKIEGLPG